MPTPNEDIDGPPIDVKEALDLMQAARHYLFVAYVAALKDRDAWKESARTEAIEGDEARKDADRLAEALQFLISDGKVDEGEGIWLGHSGQLKAEEALAAHEKIKGRPL